MQLSVANPNYMCSTLILGELWGTNGNPWSSNVPLTKAKFLALIDLYNRVHDYQVSDYAFIVATLRDDQTEAMEFLGRLGFSSSDWVYNSKNGTNVKLYSIPARDFLKNLEKYEEAGG